MIKIIPPCRIEPEKFGQKPRSVTTTLRKADASFRFELVFIIPSARDVNIYVNNIWISRLSVVWVVISIDAIATLTDREWNCIHDPGIKFSTR